jgi:hypothetical protein
MGEGVQRRIRLLQFVVGDAELLRPAQHFLFERVRPPLDVLREAAMFFEVPVHLGHVARDLAKADQRATLVAHRGDHHIGRSAPAFQDTTCPDSSSMKIA